MEHRVRLCQTATGTATKGRIRPAWLTLLLLLSVSGGASARILHHDIEAEIRPQEHAIAVVDVLTVAPAAGPTRAPLGIFLHRDLTLSEVSSVDQTVRWTVREMSSLDALSAYFPTLDPAQKPAYAMARYYQLLPAGPDEPKDEPLRLRLAYRGHIFDPLTPPAPHTPGPGHTTGVIEPRGTFLSGATFWVPQRPDDLVSFTLRTMFPEGYVSVSQGKRRMHRVADGVVRTEWQCTLPQQEVYLIAGPYVVTEERHGKVEIMTFLYKADPDLSQTYLSATRRYLDLYSRLIGPYPYPKFALVENYWQTGLGMPSFTLLGDQVIRLPFIVSTSYGHEILHNWWGNSVYVDWDTGNWSEGLTTYGADYLYKEMHSAEAARDYRKGILQEYLNAVHDEQALSLKAFRGQPARAARAIGYGKAAMVFHMLRRMVGEAEYIDSRQRATTARSLLSVLVKDSRSRGRCTAATPWAGGGSMVRNDVRYEFPPGRDGALILERLAQVLDPELDESILQLGFIRSLRLRDGHATVALELPTSRCAANFAYLMAEEIRRALLTLAQIQQVTVRLGDHFAADAIETAVNAGKPFDAAFPGEGCESLDALRATFLRKGFSSRQARVLQELRASGLSPETICGLHIGDVCMHGETCLVRTATSTMITVGSATTMGRYLDRRRELGLDSTPTAPLVIDLRGQPLSEDRLEAYYRAARTVRVSLEANGSFCRAVLAVRQHIPQDAHAADERRA